MTALRVALSAFAPLALLVSTAWAQVPVPFSCTANTGVPPIVRAEGATELVGDIVVACTGDLPASFPAVFQVFVNEQVTSRTLNASGVSLSEALLLIDEPNTPYNPAPIKVCTTATSTGCTGFNAIPGVVSANAATFAGVPVSSVPGGVKVFRITNLRANASGL